MTFAIHIKSAQQFSFPAPRSYHLSFRSEKWHQQIDGIRFNHYCCSLQHSWCCLNRFDTVFSRRTLTTQIFAWRETRERKRNETSASTSNLTTWSFIILPPLKVTFEKFVKFVVRAFMSRALKSDRRHRKDSPSCNESSLEILEICSRFGKLLGCCFFCVEKWEREIQFRI